MFAISRSNSKSCCSTSCFTRKGEQLVRKGVLFLIRIIITNDDVKRYSDKIPELELEVIAIALRRIVDYAHYTFTKQGKLELNAKIIQDISTDADIIKKLEALGIDISDSKHFRYIISSN